MIIDAILYAIIFIVLLWIIDEPILYLLLALITVYITIDSLAGNGNFFTIPAGIRTEIIYLWTFLTLGAWAKVFKIVQKVRQKYESNKNRLEDD